MLDKNGVLAGLFASWEAIERQLAGQHAQGWQAGTSLPGWRVHDVVSHVIGTESMLLGIPTPEADCDVAALGHVNNDIGVLNECWVRYLAAETPEDMMARFGDVTAQRTTLLTTMTDEAWNAATLTPAGPDSYGRFMRIRTFDCWMHAQDIREALNLPATAADLGGADARQALDEIAASMGFVIGKRGKAPDGARVELELTGGLTRSIRVAVDGRASVVDDFGGAEPTTVIRVDGLHFTRLCGGRVSPGDVEIVGDQAVGRQIVENLAYVI